MNFQDRVVRDPKWCSRCLKYDEPCQDHVGPHGEYQHYSGFHAYDPTPWVLKVVGSRFTAGNWSLEKNAEDFLVYECVGYDPRQGFWMQQIGGAERLCNVSERAIDRTFHRVRMTFGAWNLLRSILRASECPSEVDEPRARKTLIKNGYLSGTIITPQGAEALERHEAEERRER